MTPNARGLMHLVSSRHCSHTLDTTKVVPKDGEQSGPRWSGDAFDFLANILCQTATREVLDHPGDHVHNNMMKQVDAVEILLILKFVCMFQ